MPTTTTAAQYQLTVHFTGAGVDAHNQWPLWVYPQPADWRQSVVVYDPRYALQDLPELAALRGELPTAPGQVVITSVLDEPLQAYLAAGGCGLLLQTGEGALPVRRGPFWREAVKLICPHPLWAGFPQAGFVDLQFFGLATDVMTDPNQVCAALPQLTSLTPILRRLDAREFTVADYLFEAEVGKGKLLVCTLRLQGSAGVQPTGLRRNVAGWTLLAQIVNYLYNNG